MIDPERLKIAWEAAVCRGHEEGTGLPFFEAWDVLPSTNDRAAKLAADGAPDFTMVTADRQTAGKGRRGRVWETPADSSIAMSLVLRPKGIGITLAAQVCGMRTFRPESRIAGLLLCDCSGRRAESLKGILERECGLPVLGYLPPMEEAWLESRHLGLLTADEIEDFQARFDRIAEQTENSVDLDRLLALAAENGSAVGNKQPGSEKFRQKAGNTRPCCRIAVARDEAFCFHYADNLEALRQAGAALMFFSPLHDSHVPEAEGLWLCGGYPELYARQLSENKTIQREIRERVLRGCPTVAECGGFLYLQESLEDPEGTAWPMCGALPGCGYKTGRLQRFGYLKLKTEADSLLFRAGEQIPLALRPGFRHAVCWFSSSALRRGTPFGRTICKGVLEV